MVYFSKRSGRRAVLALAVGALAVPGWVQARCGEITGRGEINIVGSNMPSVVHISKEMETCSRAGVKVMVKISPTASVEVDRAFNADGKSPFDAAVISGGEYSALVAKGRLQSLTDLVAKYKAKYKIEDGMLVKEGNEVYSIAFQQNAQHLFYRKDLFDKHGIKVPTTYAEMLQAAAAIKAKEPSVEFPIAQTFSKGNSIALEFINMFAGFGGRMFKPGTALPAFNDDAGVKALELMKSMTPFMTPNYLASNTDDVTNLFQQGKSAMGVLWGSRASAMDNPAVSKVVGKIEFAAAPAVVAGGKSATHLWWDGVVIPKNLSGDRDTVFQVLMDALDEETTRAGNDATIWVRSIYRPSRFAAGVTASAKAGAPIWPTDASMAVAYGELGKILPEAMAGTMTPRQALDAAAVAYTKAATEKGFIK